MCIFTQNNIGDFLSPYISIVAFLRILNYFKMTPQMVWKVELFYLSDFFISILWRCFCRFPILRKII